MIHPSPIKVSSPVHQSSTSKISSGAFWIPVVSPNHSLFGNTGFKTARDYDRALRDDQRSDNMQRQGDFCAADDAALHGSPVLISNSNPTDSGPPCSCCRGLGHTSAKCPGKIRCWKCSMFGHKRSLCLSCTRLIWMWQPKLRIPEGDPTKDGNKDFFSTRAKPSLVCKYKTPNGKAADVLNHLASSPDSSPSHNSEQEPQDNHLHPPLSSQPPPPPPPYPKKTPLPTHRHHRSLVKAPWQTSL